VNRKGIKAEQNKKQEATLGEKRRVTYQKTSIVIFNMHLTLLDIWFGQLVVIDVNPWRVILEIDVNP
jgi:hypothetical protein